MSQTSYSIDMDAAQDGLIYDIGFNDFLSGIAEEKVIPGVLVVKGTAEKEVALPAAKADVTNPTSVRGFVALDKAKEAAADGTLEYEAKDAVSVMTEGRMWVVCEDAFTESDSVFVRHTANSPNLQLGRIRTDIDSSNAVLLSGVKFLNSGSAGELALIQFDLK